MLSMQNLTKTFITDSVQTHALREFNLTVDEGDFVAVTGPSGSGKKIWFASYRRKGAAL